MENVFDVLCSAVSERSIKELFCHAEGPDLMILMIKWALTSFHLYELLIFDRENSKSKSRCIRLLDYAMTGPDGAPVCEAFVEALGLKTIFMAFMGKVRVFYLQIPYIKQHIGLQTFKIFLSNSSPRRCRPQPWHHFFVTVQFTFGFPKSYPPARQIC